MLAVQVQYWTLQEQIRSNKVREAETKRHDLATEDLGYKTLDETIRHNKATEFETNRHNVVMEQYYTGSLEETQRHNLVTEDVSYINAAANMKQADAALANAATNRFSAVTGYSLGLEANRIADANADTNRMNAETNAENAETRKNELDWSKFKDVVGFEQIDISKQNANTAERNVDLGFENLGLNQQKFAHEKRMDVWQNVNKTLDTTGKLVDTAADVYANFNSPW